MKRYSLLFAALLVSCSSAPTTPDQLTMEDCIGPDMQRALTFCASPEAALQAMKNVEASKARASGDESFNPIPVGQSPTLGNADAPVTIVMFTDLQCGFCARGHEEVLAVYKANPEDVRIVFKNMPLPFHEQAVPAALAALAANEQGKFWEFVDIAYGSQTQLAPEYLGQYAKDMGLDFEKFKEDFGSEAHIERVQADLNLGVDLGVRGTPTLFINGVRAVGVQPLQELQRYVAHQKVFVQQLRDAGVQHDDLYWRMVALNYTPPPKPEAWEEDSDAPEPPTALYVPVLDSPFKGNPDALITIVQFSEFQCPFCARIIPVFDQLMEKYDGKIRIVYKHFPLDFHKDAMPAAKASIAAQEAGKFWEYHDLLFANQGALRTDDLVKYGASVGLKSDVIQKALDNDQYGLRVEAEMKLGASLGVQGTPTSFVNGIPVYGAQTSGWEELIDAQLELAKPLADKGLKGEELYKAIVELNIAE